MGLRTLVAVTSAKFWRSDRLTATVRDYHRARHESWRLRIVRTCVVEVRGSRPALGGSARRRVGQRDLHARDTRVAGSRGAARGGAGRSMMDVIIKRRRRRAAPCACSARPSRISRSSANTATASRRSTPSRRASRSSCSSTPRWTPERHRSGACARAVDLFHHRCSSRRTTLGVEAFGRSAQADDFERSIRAASADATRRAPAPRKVRRTSARHCSRACSPSPSAGARCAREERPRLLAEFGGHLHVLDASQVEMIEADRTMRRARTASMLRPRRNRRRSALRFQPMPGISCQLANMNYVAKRNRTLRGDLSWCAAGGATITSSEGIFRAKVKEYLGTLRFVRSRRPRPSRPGGVGATAAPPARTARGASRSCAASAWSRGR